MTATIVSSLFMSLDGVVEIDPTWHFPYFDDHMGAAVDADYSGVDVLLVGRVTYDSFAGAWPGREDAGEEDAAFAKRLGDMRKVVATRGEADLGWRTVEKLQGDLVEAVTALKETPGISKILVAGSISVVRQLLAAGLVDELSLLLHPVAARTGERLFDEGAPIYPLRLLRTEVFPTGVVHLVYAPSQLPGHEGYEDIMANVPGAGD